MNLQEFFKDDPVYHYLARHKAAVIQLVCLSVILFFAGLFRINTFWIPHWMGDQCQYVSLAMKLDKLGFGHYNLRGLDVGFIDFDKTKMVRIVYPKLEKDVESKGTMLETLDAVGIKYYDQPLFHKPPGFPCAILLSHKFFAKSRKLYTIMFSLTGSYIKKVKAQLFLESQFYAVVIPYIFSLGIIALTFVLGRMLFTGRTALYAAAILAVNPISIMTSQKLWADDMLSFFVALAVVLYLAGCRTGRNSLFLLAGAACGAGVLAKQTAGYLCFALLYFTLIDYASELDMRKFFRAVYDRKIWLFAAGVFAVTAFWFIKVYQVYGDPLYLPGKGDVAAEDATGWFKELVARPNSYIMFSVVTIFFCPLFAFALLSIKDMALSFLKIIQKEKPDMKFIFLWVIVLTFYFGLKGNREERMFLPVYPFIAVLSGFYLEKLPKFAAKFLKAFNNRVLAEILIALIIILTACWTVPIGIKSGIEQTILLKIPF